MPRREKTRPDATPAVTAARALLEAEIGGPGPALDWEAIAPSAEVERLAAWLYSLGRTRQVPAERLHPLRPAWLAFRRQHLVAVQELERLLDAFDEAGVPVIPLKGPVLAETLYRDPACRPLTDLDALVPPAQASAAIEVLRRLGYRHLGHERTLAYEQAHAGAACFVPAASSAARLPVDLHWSLLSFPGGFVPSGVRDPGVWERARRVEWLGRPVRQLADDDLLLYLALHLAVHHPLSGLRWRLELGVCLARDGDSVSWSDVAARARAWRVSGALYFALRATATTFAVAAPLGTMASLRPRGLRGKLLDRLASTVDARPSLEYLVNVVSLDTAADRLRLARRGLAPSPSWVRARYDSPSAVRGWREHYGRALGALKPR